jgi:diaminopropionate ammonia-lyase
MYLNPAASSWTYNGPPPSSEVELFHQQLPDYNTTPLVPLLGIAKELGLGHVFVKDESSRFGLPAFKILGASWAIYKAVASRCGVPLPCSLDELGTSARAHDVKLVTCTDGNWGRATARMAKYLQIQAVIYVPKFMDRATRKKIVDEGASVVPVDGDYDIAVHAARDAAESSGGLLVMDVSFEGYKKIPQVCNR